MRFDRYPRSLGRSTTPSKARLVAAQRALKKEREKAPLFAAEIAAEQPTPEERVQRLDAGAEAWLTEHRQSIASSWHRSRGKLRAMPADQALAIANEWQYGYLPGSAEYLADLIHRRLRGDKASTSTAQRIAAWVAGNGPGGHSPGRPLRRWSIPEVDLLPMLSEES